MKPFFLLSLIILSVEALEPFPEQTLLPMTTPNITKNKSVHWIPLTSSTQGTPVKNTKTSPKAIDESIKNQIQKKMQSLLKPLEDETQQP